MNAGLQQDGAVQLSPATCGWCGQIPHKPGCLEERKQLAQLDREVPVAQALDRSELERELEIYRGREIAVRIQLAAIVNLTQAIDAKDRTAGTLAAALERTRKRAEQGLAIYDGARAGASAKA
jgi:hypothetical protein